MLTHDAEMTSPSSRSRLIENVPKMPTRAKIAAEAQSEKNLDDKDGPKHQNYESQLPENVLSEQDKPLRNDVECEHL